MKKPIYYAIRHQWGRPNIVVVTTERKDHWWGRDLDSSIGTHGRTSDIDGRFDTVEAALAVRDEVAGVRRHFTNQASKLEQARQSLRRAEEASVREIVQGLPARGANLLSVEVRVWNERGERVG